MRLAALLLFLPVLACGSPGSSDGGSTGGSSGAGTFDGTAHGPDGGTVACQSNSDCPGPEETANFFPCAGTSCVDDSVVCSGGMCQCQRPNVAGGQSCYDDCDCQSGACPGATGSTLGTCCPSKGTGASGSVCHSPCECASDNCQSSGYCL
ncbi:MAG: hypothetical protein ACYDCL_08375 [Myxococcales bacterium]